MRFGWRRRRRRGSKKLPTRLFFSYVHTCMKRREKNSLPAGPLLFFSLLKVNDMKGILTRRRRREKPPEVKMK
jgi:hypothetical protein